ncbi:MAG: NYN domain-containing protein [Desulfomonile tiedjei]|nr:NYN domain-containing protein [Desulfomonile tiedjei]
MPYLIDGNNVMAQTIGWHKDKVAARRNLIHSLAKFLAVRKAKVTVVFDGPQDAEFPEGSKYKSVKILYAHPGSDADSRIKDLVKKSTNKRDLILVSSDKALGGFVAHQGARVMPSGQFRKLLEEAAAMSPTKPMQTEHIDIDDWLDFFKRSDKN